MVVWPLEALLLANVIGSHDWLMNILSLTIALLGVNFDLTLGSCHSCVVSFSLMVHNSMQWISHFFEVVIVAWCNEYLSLPEKKKSGHTLQTVPLRPYISGLHKTFPKRSVHGK